MTASEYSGRVRTRGCAIVVKNGALLLVKQSVPTRPHSVWLAPGGEVQLGETAREAARRETFEETGLYIDPTHLVAVHEFIEPPFHAVELYFLSEISGGSMKVGTDPEHHMDDQQISDVAFINLDQLRDLQIVPEFLKGARDIIDSALEGQVLHFSDE